MVAFRLCFTPIILACTLAAGLNIAMLKSISHMNRKHWSTHFIFTSTGISNLSVCLLLVVRSASNAYTSEIPTLEAIVLSAVVSSYFSQFGINVALAYDRYVAVRQPLKYRSGLWLKTLKKLFAAGLAVIIIISLVLSFVCTLQFKQKSYLLYIVGVSRLAGCLIFVVIYSKVYKSFKASRLRTTHVSRSAKPECSAVAQNIRARMESHLLKICIGVSGSYILLNLPMMIYDSFVSFSDNCETVEGEALVAVVTLMNINMVLDPCWFFFMARRDKCVPQTQWLKDAKQLNRKKN